MCACVCMYVSVVHLVKCFVVIDTKCCDGF